MKVKVLPPSLADKIAAGEVVERPASVVKELVENSLDAGAQNISVEIKRGGITFIRVTDDGYGMRPEDAKTAFLRHATSKISEVDDLNNIGTYGFRGEALAAICSVSKVELITSTDSAATAFYLELEGGDIVQEDEIGAPVGTSIIVRDLFYNTPARLHFMKKDSTEAAAVATMLERIAIGRYDVSFTLISDQKVVFRTARSDDMKNAIHAIYGATISDYLMKVDFVHKDYLITGYTCKPNVMRSNRNMQFTYVNGRFVKSKILYQGIDQAYSTTRETGKHPVCFLCYTMEPKEVDVNVHPAKLEVKFRDDSAAIVLTKYGVLDALESDSPLQSLADPSFQITREELFDGSWMKKQTTPACARVTDYFGGYPFAHLASYDEEEKPRAAVIRNPRTPEEVLGYYIGPLEPDPDDDENYENREDREDREDREGEQEHLDQQDLFDAPFVSQTTPSTAKEEPRTVSAPVIETHYTSKSSLNKLPDGMVVLGEIFTVYAVVEYQDTLFLIDKHAAHEKMIYNQLLEQVTENNNVSSQRLLEPLVIVLPADDMEIVLTNSLLFYSAGFDFYESGMDRISVTSVPGILPHGSYTDAFVDLLEMVRSNKNIPDRQNKMLKTIACRSAIKGGSSCSVEELLPLIARMLTEKDVGYCPHGRPVVQSFTHKEIDKMFKRIK